MGLWNKSKEPVSYPGDSLTNRNSTIYLFIFTTIRNNPMRNHFWNVSFFVFKAIKLFHQKKPKASQIQYTIKTWNSPLGYAIMPLCTKEKLVFISVLIQMTLGSHLLGPCQSVQTGGERRKQGLGVWRGLDSLQEAIKQGILSKQLGEFLPPYWQASKSGRTGWEWGIVPSWWSTAQGWRPVDVEDQQELGRGRDARNWV